MKCILCSSDSVHFFEPSERYWKCNHCQLVFLDPQYRLTPEAEKSRYLLHNNNIEDSRYQNFVRPILDEIKERFDSNSQGLDFGAGAGPVGCYLFEQEGYSIQKYDPFFWPDKACLNLKYDFIFSCEVAEHFFNPYQEFFLLRRLLHENSVLIIKTVFFEEGIDFKNWYYKKDPTHVCFYSPKTMEWLRDHFQFTTVEFKLKGLTCLSVGVGNARRG